VVAGTDRLVVDGALEVPGAGWADDVPGEGAGDAEPADEAPAEEVPAEEVPAEEEPAEEEPAEEEPADEVPAEEVPADDGSSADAPAADGPAVDVPAADDDSADADPAGADPADGEPDAVPADDDAADDDPADDEPADDDPADGEPHARPGAPDPAVLLGAVGTPSTPISTTPVRCPASPYDLPATDVAADSAVVSPPRPAANTGARRPIPATTSATSSAGRTPRHLRAARGRAASRARRRVGRTSGGGEDRRWRTRRDLTGVDKSPCVTSSRLAVVGRSTAERCDRGHTTTSRERRCGHARPTPAAWTPATTPRRHPPEHRGARRR
jgi:hypothetical protein